MVNIILCFVNIFCKYDWCRKFHYLSSLSYLCIYHLAMYIWNQLKNEKFTTSLRLRKWIQMSVIAKQVDIFGPWNFRKTWYDWYDRIRQKLTHIYDMNRYTITFFHKPFVEIVLCVNYWCPQIRNGWRLLYVWTRTSHGWSLRCRNQGLS